MSKPTLHLLSVPHTLTSPKYSHCAFSQKVLRFIPMMQEQGFDVIHYGNGQTLNPGCEHIQVLDDEDFIEFVGVHDPRSPRQIGIMANTSSPLYRKFNSILARLLREQVKPSDIICLPFGLAHKEALDASVDVTGKAYWVETGIGYAHTFAPFKIFESQCWMNFQAGKTFGEDNKKGYSGNDYNWVIPNYFDIKEWDFNQERGEYVAYLGRIQEDKGLRIIQEVAKRRPDLKFKICGQGDPTLFLLPNIEYVPPIHGKERSDYLRKAIAVMCPSRYIEPFCGVAVEAMLCGRPVIASSFGAFQETLPDGILRRFNSRTLSGWLQALKETERLNRHHYGMIRESAEGRFSMETVGPMYSDAFNQISDLSKGGWYANC
jgi:glycosyltransferase involved in cell wall biosynthesis